MNPTWIRRIQIVLSHHADTIRFSVKQSLCFTKITKADLIHVRQAVTLKLCKIEGQVRLVPGNPKPFDESGHLGGVDLTVTRITLPLTPDDPL